MSLPREQVARLLDETKAARTDGKLRGAVEKLDVAFTGSDPRDTRAAQALAEEGVRLGLALEAAGAPLAALSEHLRAWDAARQAPAREGISRGARRYAEWRPAPIEVLPGSSIRAAATGAFWVGVNARARVVILEGGITTESVGPAKRALERASQEVNWLAIDMKALGYVGSSGLAAMVKVAETLSDQGGGIVLFEVASALMVLIDTLGLGRYFSPVQGLEAALGKIHERRLATASAKNPTAT